MCFCGVSCDLLVDIYRITPRVLVPDIFRRDEHAPWGFRRVLSAGQFSHPLEDQRPKTDIWRADDVKPSGDHVVRPRLVVVSQARRENPTTRSSSSHVQLRRPIQGMSNDVPVDPAGPAVSASERDADYMTTYRSVEWYIGTAGKNSNDEVARK